MTTSLLPAAIRLHGYGYTPLPVRTDGSKAPIVTWRGVTDTQPDAETVTAWFTAHDTDGVGVVCGPSSGELEMLEFEGRAVHLIDTYSTMLADHGAAGLWAELNAGWVEVSPAGGVHYHYRIGDGPAQANTRLARDTGGKVLIETRGRGGFTIVAPSAGRSHPSGNMWAVIAGGPDTCPVITVEQRDMLHAVATLLDETPEPVPPPPPSLLSQPAGAVNGALRPGDDYNTRADWADLLVPAGWQYAGSLPGGARGWRRPGKTAGMSATTGRNDADNLYVFSTSTSFDAERPYSKFGAFTLLHHGGDYSSAARALYAQGYGERHAAAPLTSLAAATTGGGDATEVGIERGDGERHRGQPRIAYRLAQRYADRLLYVPGVNWHVWDGTRWAADRGGAGGTRAVLETLRAALAEVAGLDAVAGKELHQDVRRCETDNGVRGVLALASALPELAAAVTDLDADPYLLNTPGGTFDLRTGQIRPCDPRDRITKVTGAGIDTATGAAAGWERFLTEVLPDADVRAFLRRLAGLGLVGKVIEHILPILIGSGRNGKGTFVRVVNSALGDYAIEVEPELFTARDNAHPTGQLDLRGIRLATCQETDEGKRLAVSTVKRLTGGDTIRARAMRQDFVEFTPSHLPVLVTNHLPRVPADDPALWARLRVIPFTESFEGREDTGLEDRLALELAGVLGWAVAGWLDYRTARLAEPGAVLVATKSYRFDADVLAKFIADRCTLGPYVHVGSRELFAAWRVWCADVGEIPGTDREFGPALEAHGFEARHTMTGRRWAGLALSTEDDGDDGIV